jgi:hypothetical protein
MRRTLSDVNSVVVVAQSNAELGLERFLLESVDCIFCQLDVEKW